jgi:hypothetical protein
VVEPKEPENCYVCNKLLKIQEVVHAVTVVVKGRKVEMKGFPGYHQVDIEEIRAICNDPTCAVALHTELLEKAKKEVAGMNKTNAVGPVSPGAPGCAFNDSMLSTDKPNEKSPFNKNQTNAVGPVARGAPGCAFNGDPKDSPTNKEGK